MQEEVKAMDKQREKLIGVLAYAASDAYSIDTKKDVEELADFILADEEIKHAFELLKAEKEGRLIVPPCKVGDTVYFDMDGYLDSAEIDGIHIDAQGTMFTWVQYDVGVDVTELWDEGEFDLDDIGKTVFLSREDAEKALEERKDK